MSARLRILGLVLVLATSACAPVERHLASLDARPKLEAWGPGTVFPSVEAAAVDALVYAYLQAREQNDMQRMRGGTIYAVERGYTYGEIHVAQGMLVHQISYPLKPQDVARLQMYVPVGDRDVDRRNERATQADRRSVAVNDPLHRPLFILHPSLVIREYRGRDDEVVAVADLRSPTGMILVAGE